MIKKFLPYLFVFFFSFLGFSATANAGGKPSSEEKFSSISGSVSDSMCEKLFGKGQRNPFQSSSDDDDESDGFVLVNRELDETEIDHGKVEATNYTGGNEPCSYEWEDLQFPE